jgi:hypothetical protein
MVVLEQQGGPLGKWGLCLKNVIHSQVLDITLKHGKVVEVLDRINF